MMPVYEAYERNMLDETSRHFVKLRRENPYTFQEILWMGYKVYADYLTQISFSYSAENPHLASISPYAAIDEFKIETIHTTIIYHPSKLGKCGEFIKQLELTTLKPIRELFKEYKSLYCYPVFHKGAIIGIGIENDFYLFSSYEEAIYEHI